MSEEMKDVVAVENGPVVTMKKLIEAGAHFGHYTKKWDPRMREYIYTSKNGIYIIDLAKTVVKVEESFNALKKIVADGGKVLFVCTSKPSDEIVREEALRCGSFYVTNRWLGGTLTNFKTIQKRIKYLQGLKDMTEDGTLDQLTKKEGSKIKKMIIKLESNLGGIKEMRKIPNAVFVVDPTGEDIAVKEAIKLKIPVFGICDTNSNPEVLNYVIPANDNSSKTIRLIVQLMADAILEGRGSADIVAAYGKDDGEDATMLDALKNVEAYEEKRQQLAAQNASKRDDRNNRGRKKFPNKPYRPKVVDANVEKKDEAASTPAEVVKSEVAEKGSE